MIKILHLFQKWKSSKTKLADLFHFSLGNYRYKLYYYRRYKERFRKPLTLLMRSHIEQQINYRIQWMDRECYDNGSCKLCECETTALQMSNKSCDKPCYPAMMTRLQWRRYKIGQSFKDNNGLWLALISQNNKPILFKETTYGFTPQTNVIPEDQEQNTKDTRQDYPNSHL